MLTLIIPPADLFDEKIRDIAGSVFSETGRELDRSKLLGECMEIFEGLYEKYIQSGDMSLIKKEYESILLNKDAGVRILDPKGEYEAVSRGIADDGSLLIELPDGTTKTINAGEVSVRGLYGYT